MSLSVLFAITLYHSVTSNTIKCDTDSACKNGIYNCNDGEDCNIICSASDACNSGTFNCPKSNKCNITCETMDGSACEKAHFYTYDTTTLLSTGQNQQFFDAQLHCGSNSDCEVQCGTISNSLGNDGMCFQSHIYAQTANKLKITALGQETLRRAHIYCPETGDCIIDLIGTDTGNYKISNTAIFVNDPDKVNLKLTCVDNSGDACYGDTANAPILYCYNATHSCTYITNDGSNWYCYEQNSPCGTNNTFSPTFMPTNEPSNAPSMPTNAPTINPTGDSIPTNEPTKAPNNSPNTDGSNSSNGGWIAVVIVLIIICCVISIFFAYKWNERQKRGGSAYQGLLET